MTKVLPAIAGAQIAILISRSVDASNENMTQITRVTVEFRWQSIQVEVVSFEIGVWPKSYQPQLELR